WHMTTVVLDVSTSSLTIQVDDGGRLYKCIEVVGATGLTTSGQNLKIAGPYGGDSYYDGVISQFAWFNSTALTVEERYQLFEYGYGGQFDQEVFSTSPEVWWKMSDAQNFIDSGSATTFDSSGT